MAKLNLGVDAPRLAELKQNLEDLKDVEDNLIEAVDLGLMPKGLLEASQETMRKIELLIKMSS